MYGTSNPTDEWTTSACQVPVGIETACSGTLMCVLQSLIDGRVCSEAAADRIRQWTVAVARRLQRRNGRAAGKDPLELGAGSDAELEEHLAQVVLDRPRADE